MSQPKETRVFILGAGCSATCGYPLGKSLARELDEFQSEISGRFPNVERCVRETINLANGLAQFETLDQLAKHIEDDFHSWRGREGGIVCDEASEKREEMCRNQILDAKIATAAMFLAREEKAMATGLPSYERFIASIFGGEPWQEAVKAADCHVLTFNYDRLFEIGFLKQFKDFDPRRLPLYAKDALNSGFNDQVNGGYDKASPASGRFSFLKLHGSAGWWVKKWHGNRGRDDCRLYWPAEPVTKFDMNEIEAFLQKKVAQPWEPLIVFPHEKQRSMRNVVTDFPWDPYIRRIWDHAASLLASATEVRVVGYSFSAIDSRHMVGELLSKATACETIVIQDPDKARVDANLKSYAVLKERLEFRETRFGENL